MTTRAWGCAALSAIACTLLTAGVSFAGEGGVHPAGTPVVQVNAGEALVNTGDGFRPIGSGTPLEPGSQLLPSINSVISIVYPDGTVVPVQPGVITIVTDGAGPLSGSATWQTAVVEGATDVQPPAVDGVAGPGFPGVGAGLPTSTLLAVAGVGAAAAGVVAIASGGGNSPPASP